ncbi:hypothetical protein J4217_00840 [Candidatus Pacearchaeota archaeon]|nr:hypothetical protein [Candidatus Pacearchaeota archaeon]
MFFKKKEDKSKLPDLPPLPMRNMNLQPRDSQSFERLPSFGSADKELRKEISEGEQDSIDSEERHSLPSFPDSPMERGFSQSAIKEAVSDEPEDLPKLSESFESDESVGSPMPKKIKVVEADQSGFKKVESSNWYSATGIDEPSEEKSITNARPVKIKEIGEVKSSMNEISVGKNVAKNQDIFVRIDKYRSARKSLDEIDFRLNEIDSLLKKIRETKLREEQEMNAWDRELNTIREKLKDVTGNIFEKAD